MTGDSERAEWIVESIGDETVSVERDGEAVVQVPRWLLPATVREGDVLAVTRERDGDRVTVTIERDPATTQAALDASAEQMRDAPIDTKGGDVTL